MADKQPIIIKKKKGGGGHGHHGGAWKVAYADFVTAMMAFFLVMWLMGSDEETKAAISHYFNHPNTPYKQGGDPQSSAVHPMGEKEGHGESVLSGAAGLWPEDLIERPAPVNSALKEYLTISKMIEELLEGTVYGVDATPEHVKFSLPESVLFKAGTNEFTKDATGHLELLGSLLKNFRGYVKIEGHTDDLPVRSGPYSNNWELSMGRAVAVMDYFIKHHKMREDRLIPVGQGARNPAYANDKLENRIKNRRVEFTLMYDPDF